MNNFLLKLGKLTNAIIVHTILSQNRLYQLHIKLVELFITGDSPVWH